MREYIVDPFETTRVSEIMAKPVDTLSGEMTINDVVAFFTAPDATERHKSYPVLDEKGALMSAGCRSFAAATKSSSASSRGAICCGCVPMSCGMSMSARCCSVCDCSRGAAPLST